MMLSGYKKDKEHKIMNKYLNTVSGICTPLLHIMLYLEYILKARGAEGGMPQ